MNRRGFFAASRGFEEVVSRQEEAVDFIFLWLDFSGIHVS